MGKKKRTNKEFKFRVGIDSYKMDDVIIYFIFDVNILPKRTCE